MDFLPTNATWTAAPPEFDSPVIIKTFTAEAGERAVISASSLGFFTLYLNGQRVGDEYFTPLNSMPHEFSREKISMPIRDKMTFRAYCHTYELTPYLAAGENTLEVHLGNGWYRQRERLCELHTVFGERLAAIFEIRIFGKSGERSVCSCGGETCRTSPLTYCQLYIGEVYDGRIARDESYEYGKCEAVSFPDTILTPADSIPDRISEKIKPTLIYTDGERKIYDAGKNISGFATVICRAADGGRVTVRHSEELTADRQNIDPTSTLSVLPNGPYILTSGIEQIQTDVCIGCGQEYTYAPSFVWHGFRYAELVGDGEIEYINVVHTDTRPPSFFESSSPELDRVYSAYIRAQLNNMHGGVPSDCPHRERLGYTGDGQVCAPAAMLMFDPDDMRAFYRKWLRDIFDCQDSVTGHINHTSPFAGGGGGPGGWGCAGITLPYNYYKAFADASMLSLYYDRMKLWMKYLECHSENGLVTHEEPHGWCLGDWVTTEDAVIIPPALVNTAYMIKCSRIMCDVARLTGHEADIPYYEGLRDAATAAMKREYLAPDTGSYAEGVQGADCFAIFAGLGDKRTYDNIRRKYTYLGRYDTGFIATDLLTEQLFAGGDADLAYELMTAHRYGCFGLMLDRDATTFWEYWSEFASHDHPMFGTVARHLLSGILGIGQADDSVGYEKILISPKPPRKLARARGGVRTVRGDITVGYERADGRIDFTVTLPCPAVFDFGGERREISAGTSKMSFPDDVSF